MKLKTLLEAVDTVKYVFTPKNHLAFLKETKWIWAGAFMMGVLVYALYPC